MIGRGLALGGLLALLAGCAVEPARQVPAPSPEAFVLSGRIAVRADPESFSGSLRWDHSGGSDRVSLLSPLGQTVARIESGPGEFVVLVAGREPVRGASADDLLRQVLGWEFPLDGLRFWVLGRAAPDSDARLERDEAGRVTRLTQQGWQVDYLRWSDAGLPATLRARRGNVEVRLVIDAWE